MEKESKMEKICKRLIHHETVRYLFFGVMTTIVNFTTYFICDIILGRKYYLVSNVFSFLSATIFAFVTNKIFVFKSSKRGYGAVIKEFLSFISARVGTFLLIEEMGLWISVSIFKVEKVQWYFFDGTLISKIFLAFLAVLVNYLLSKKIIFRE